jgi:chemotaxis methyl-accepting protein methylase
MSRFLEAAQERRRRLGVTPAQSWNLLDKGLTEWLEIWNLAAKGLEAGFFQWPAQLDALIEVIQEWAPFAPKRRLKVLSLNSGAGYEAASLAMALLSSGLKAKGWEIVIYGLEMIPDLVKEAKLAIYSPASLAPLPKELSRRFFVPRSGGFHFEAAVSDYRHFNLNPARLENPPEELWAADLIVARGLTWDALDQELTSWPQRLKPLFGPDCFLLTAPGEFWPGLTDFYLEERDGVTYYRRDTGRPVGRLGKKPYQKESPSPEPQIQSLRWLVEEKLAEDPALARETAVELIHEEALEGYLRPESLANIARIEEALGRSAALKAVREVLNSLQSDALG